MINKALRTLWIYNGIFVFAGALFGPLYAVYIQKITINPIIISLSWAVFLITGTLATFLISRIGDRFREKEYLLMAGFLVRAIAWFSYIFVADIFSLLTLQVLLGLGEALGGPSFNALVAEHLDKGRHIEEFSDMSIIFNMGGALATIIGGVIVYQFGYQILFLLMASLALVSFIGVVLKPRHLL